VTLGPSAGAFRNRYGPASDRLSHAVPPRWWDGPTSGSSRLCPVACWVRLPGNKVQKMAGVLGSDDLADLHLRLASHFQHPARLVVAGPSHGCSPERITPAGRCRGADEYLDSVTYLPDDILSRWTGPSDGVSLEPGSPSSNTGWWSWPAIAST